MGQHADIDSFYLCHTYAKIPKHLLRDNANLLILFKQDQFETHIQRSHKHRHVLRGFLRIISQLLATKIWIPSD